MRTIEAYTSTSLSTEEAVILRSNDKLNNFISIWFYRGGRWKLLLDQTCDPNTFVYRNTFVDTPKPRTTEELINLITIWKQEEPRLTLAVGTQEEAYEILSEHLL